MKKFTLGLDLGITSIGWALVSTDAAGNKSIVDMGSRIIPLSTDDKDEFSKGNAISKNQKRTARRTQRKGYFRYKLRRSNLKAFLEQNGMQFPDALMHCTAATLFGLRARAAVQQVSLPELGRILYHLNQKRGYKSSRSDANLDKKDTAYVAEVKNRHQLIREAGQTIGQYFLEGLRQEGYYRIKQQVFPREAYIEEFDTIIAEQCKHYPEVLSEKAIHTLRNEIIYYQRRLKSQKDLVSICEFEGEWKKDKSGKDVFAGPKVAPRSSPLFQVGKIWESINTIALKNKRGEAFAITPEQRYALFNYLDNNKALSEAELFRILGLKKSDGWYGNKQTAKGIQGNLTKCAIKEHLGDTDLLKFELITRYAGEEVFLTDKDTGEVKDAREKMLIDPSFEAQPLYRLWHTIYSIPDAEECSKALQRTFNMAPDVAANLAGIDFTRSGFGNKSARAIRKILPYLQEGYAYSDASSFAGYNHSRSWTGEERLKQTLLPRLELLKKNSLRQPVVEKILNQLIHVVNAIIDRHGRPDEIRIELARELKQSQEERNNTFAALNKRERENKAITERIETEYRHLGIRATRNTILKWRLFHEISDQESKVNATCIYCGQPFGISDALSGNSVDIEHIIPRSRLFDDSQSNKTLVHRRCNEDKGDRTAYDFMESRGAEVLSRYLETVDTLYKNRVIGKGKRDKLLLSSDKIPKDFIDRQLRATQYIARKAKELLENVCYNVWSTSGNITEYLRRIWGWNEVLMNLQLPRYRDLGLTEQREWQTRDGQVHIREEIKGWSKRDDHRHHAIDALVIACTEQGFIQRINTLNASKTRDEMRRQVESAGRQYDARKNLLENYIYAHKPFTTREVEEAAAGILISFKAGKKVATISRYKARGKNVHTGVLVPRGPLSEESVYGKIKVLDQKKPVKYLLEHPDLIFNPYIKALVEERLAASDHNVRQALGSLKKDPLFLDKEKTKPLEYGTCYREEYVIKYPLAGIKAKDVPYIIDKKLRELVAGRLQAFGNNEKEAFKTTLWFDEARQIPVSSIRCRTGLSAVVPIKKDQTGRAISFVKPGSNHHVAIYLDEKGKRQEHICSFWNAVERKRYRFPVIIDNPAEVWNKVLNSPEAFPESFLSQLPGDKWQFAESLQQQEMFVMGLPAQEVEKALSAGDTTLLSKHLYLVWSISENDYWFRHHLETKNSELKTTIGAKESKRYYRCKSISAFYELNPYKLKLDVLGKIVYPHTSA